MRSDHELIVDVLKIQESNILYENLSDELGFEISWEDAQKLAACAAAASDSCVVSFNVSIVAHLLYV